LEFFLSFHKPIPDEHVLEIASFLLFHWSFVCLEAVSRILSRKKNSNGSLLSNTQIKRPMKIEEEKEEKGKNAED
tara:strand:+ start:405 stop:629 length:225 start_codon:yes stop_codon:yes gene_type:complete